jgi:hypothetical protein
VEMCVRVLVLCSVHIVASSFVWICNWYCLSRMPRVFCCEGLYGTDIVRVVVLYALKPTAYNNTATPLYTSKNYMYRFITKPEH